MHSVSVLSRYMHNRTKQHLGAAKRVLGHIAGTTEFGIWYSKDADFKLFGYSDSDWVGCLDDRKSTSGHVFSFGFRRNFMEFKEVGCGCFIFVGG